MTKEDFKPVDLGHLEDKAVTLRNYLEASQDPDRSKEYREVMFKKAVSLSDTLVHDFRYYFDTYLVGGIEPYGLSEPPEAKD